MACVIRSSWSFCYFIFQEIEDSVNRVFEIIDTYADVRGSRLDPGSATCVPSDNIGIILCVNHSII